MPGPGGEHIHHSFGWAVDQLKLGGKVRRSSWGDGTYIDFREGVMTLRHSDNEKTAPWYASSVSMMAEDWTFL